MANRQIQPTSPFHFIKENINYNYSYDSIVADMTPLAADTLKEIEKTRADTEVQVARLQADAAIKVANSQFEAPARQETIRASLIVGLIALAFVSVLIIVCVYLPPDQVAYIVGLCITPLVINGIPPLFKMFTKKQV